MGGTIMTTYKVGDRVKLTGRLWDTASSYELKRGTIHTVQGVPSSSRITLNGLNWSIIIVGWEVELVEEQQTNLLYTKLAGDLTLSDLGEDRMLRWMPLRGKKPVNVPSPIRVSHIIKSKQVTVAREYEYKYGTKLQYSYMKTETKRLRWDTEVEVHEVPDSD